MQEQYLPIWEGAKPYLNTRSNDRHTLYCYYFAEQLLASYPDADETVVLSAMILHDVGWSTVPEDKQLLSFGPHMQYPELRRQHELEGVRIASEILQSLGYAENIIDAVSAIIDGHDTRKESHSIEDAIVRDADKLWRYTDFGLETLAEWFDFTTEQQMELLAQWIETRFFTDVGRVMARGLYGYMVIKSISPSL
ncbi:MAG: HD domain-containing protein [Chloroflexota bacterium]